MRNIVLVVFAAFILAGCEKQEEPEWELFRNPAPVTLILDFYPFREDYNNCTNVLRSVAIAPHDSVEVDCLPFNEFREIYVDIYTDQYTGGNWLSFINEPTRQLHSGTNIFEGGFIGEFACRQILLDGYKRSTTWKAVKKDNHPVPFGESYTVEINKARTYLANMNGVVSSGTIDMLETGPTGGYYEAKLSVYLQSETDPFQSWCLIQGGRTDFQALPSSAFGSDTLHLYYPPDPVPKFVFVKQP